MLHIAAGFAAAALLIGWGLWPMIGAAREEARFARFKREVRAIWAREVADEDIIAHTGEDCWWAAFADGKTAQEAVLGAEF